MWNGFHGPVQLANKTLNHPGHVDAAFRMPRAGNPEDRDYVYLFQVGLPEIKTGGEKSFSFIQQSVQLPLQKACLRSVKAVKVQLSLSVNLSRSRVVATFHPTGRNGVSLP